MPRPVRLTAIGYRVPSVGAGDRVSRILVFETVQRNIRVVNRTLGTLGYDITAVDDPDRLKLEIRAQPPDLILASADIKQGSGLDLVRDRYRECKTPPPVIVWSGYHDPDALKDLAPVQLLLGGVLASPLDPGELVRLVTMLAPPADPAAAVQVIADLASDVPEGIRLEPPEGSRELGKTSLPRMLCAVDYHDWTGCIRVQVEGGRSWSLFFEMGQLVLASSQDRDLVVTAQLLGRLKQTAIPDYPLRGIEDEIGLLMALRGIGAHETEWIAEETAVRLVAEVLDAWDGSVDSIPGLEPPDQFPQPLPVVPLVLRSVRQRSKSRGPRVLDAHPDSVIVVRLPSDSMIRSWVLPETELAVIQQLTLARRREVTLAQLLRVVAGDDVDKRALVEALLALLQQVGYVHFSGRPFGAEATEKMEAFVQELHRLSRIDHFAALGIKPDAGEKEIRRALRDRSLQYHPDTLFDQHPRVLETASALQARIQEAYDILKDPDARDEYRHEIGESGEQVADEAAAKVEMARGKIKLRHKRYDDAVKAFRDATLLDPDNVAAKVQLAWTRFLADPSEPRRTMGEMSRIVKEHDGHPDPWYYLGRLSLLQKDFGRARRYFNKALGLAPEHVEASRELRLMDRRGQAVPNVDAPDTEEEAEEKKPKGLLARLRGR